MNRARPSLPSAVSLLGLLLVACDVIEPAVVLDTLEWVAVSAGREHTCALSVDARLACWGANDLGQLGDGTSWDRRIPVLANVQGPFGDVSAGAEHTCVVRASAEGMCWGANQAGQVGSGVLTHGGIPPSPLRGALSFAVVSAGGTHSCGVANGGIGFCWGGNQTGSLGTGTLIDSSSPVIVWGERPFRVLRAGDTHSCGIDDQARGWCWGNNQFAQVVSASVSITGSPVSRSGAALYDIGVGEHWTCALLIDRLDVIAGGDVRCWGVRWDRTAADGSHPVSRDGWAPEIASASTPVALAVGARHACIVSEAMRVLCWGQ